MNKKLKIECSICKEKIKDIDSHNSEPINNGRCCADCNWTKVIPKRLNQFFKTSE